MNKELLEKIEALEKEINELKEKYGKIHDYQLVTTIFDKLGVTDIEVSYDEINKNNSLYLVEFSEEEQKVYIRKEIKSKEEK